MFDKFHIPKHYLLSKTGDVNDEGQFVSQYKNQKERMGKSLGALSGGRVSICEIAVTYGIKAITIAMRYAASRRQFGPEDSNIESPVIEYQSQQYRLIPHLSSIFAIQFFSNFIGQVFGQMMLKSMMGEDVSGTGMELHALSSVAKPVCAWTVRDVIQECREACGGHGYLKYAQLGELRGQNDANCTYEGENNILIQQTSNFLLNQRKNGWKSFDKKTELGTVEFLKNGENILGTKWIWNEIEDAMNPETLQATLDWICVYLLEKTAKRVKQLQNEGQSQFDVRNNSQVFGAINLSIAYGHRSIFFVFFNRIKSLSASPEKNLLMKVLSLYGANIIVKNYLGVIYEGGFSNNHKIGELLETGILRLLPTLKNECISMIDAIAQPDFIINSPLGMQDGKVYAHLKSQIFTDPDTFNRPTWWSEILKPENLNSKL
jgi:acyl-CoA oxidase